MCLKFVMDLPRMLPADLVLWRFPRFQKIVFASGFVDENALVSPSDTNQISFNQQLDLDRVGSFILKIENGSLSFASLVRSSFGGDIDNVNSSSSSNAATVGTGGRITNPSILLSNCQIQSIIRKEQGVQILAMRIISSR